MNTRELWTQLSQIENGIDQFSFGELSVSEASDLKKSFTAFKQGLERKVFGEVNEETIIVEPNDNNKTISTIAENSLIANVSHEIRTPLNGIVGFVDLLKETKLTKKQQELVDALGKSSNNLMDIINELLEFSKLSAGKEKFESIVFHPRSLLNELSYLCKTLIVDKRIAYNLKVDHKIPEYLIGDPSKLSQVLLNLLGNAVKFVEKGEINLTVSLKERSVNNLRLGFKIHDTGIGISGEKLEQIFASYQQAELDTHAKYGGTGLGLSIVKKIVEQLKGSISVSSTLGKGTTFRVDIPYLEASKKSPKIKSKKIETDTTKNELVGMAVLVFEDNELNQKLIDNRLRGWGCKAMVTHSGIHGLKMLNEHPIDLILMDLRMPEMTGLEVVKKIRNSPDQRIRNTKIIALSADFTSSEKEEFKKLGINDFILKPFKPKDLLEKMSRNNKKRKMPEQETRILITPAISKANRISHEIDLEPVLEDCMGQIPLLDELIRLFDKNILEFIGKTKVHLLNDDFEGIAFTTHKIKSGLRMFRLNSLIEVCEQMCLVCKTDKDIKHLSFLFEEFLKGYETMAPKIKLEIQRIKSN